MVLLPDGADALTMVAIDRRQQHAFPLVTPEVSISYSEQGIVIDLVNQFKNSDLT